MAAGPSGADRWGTRASAIPLTLAGITLVAEFGPEALKRLRGTSRRRL